MAAARWLDLLMMPLGLWGLALAIATLAYWQRRHAASHAATATRS